MPGAFFVLRFQPMQLTTPRAVPMADRMLMSVWMTIFQIDFLSMIIRD